MHLMATYISCLKIGAKAACPRLKSASSPADELCGHGNKETAYIAV